MSRKSQELSPPDPTSRLARRRWWWLLLIPLVAIFVADTIVIRQPPPPPFYLTQASSSMPLTAGDTFTTITLHPNVGENALLILDLSHTANGVPETWVLDLDRNLIFAPDSPLSELDPARAMGVFKPRQVAIRHVQNHLDVYLDDELIWHRPSAPKFISLRTFGIDIKTPDYKSQRLAPFRIADDFGRTTLGDIDIWKAHSGQWRTLYNETHAAAPNQFIAAGTALPGESARITTGYPFWDQYRIAASVKLNTADTASLLLAQKPSGAHLELRLTQTQLQLIRQPDTTTRQRPQVLSSTPLCLLPDAWYRLSATIHPDGNLTCLIDDAPVASVQTSFATHGQIGLAVTSGTAHFDDIDLQSPVPPPATEPPTLRAISTSYSEKPRYEKDDRDDHLDRWAKDADAWTLDTIPHHEPATQAYRFHLPLFADFQLQLPDQPATVTLTDLNDHLLATYRLLPNTALIRQDGNLTTSEDHPATELAGPIQIWYHPAADYTFTAPEIRTHHVFQEFFEQAPTEWFPLGGTWQMTNRWQCEPKWAFYGGKGPQLVGQMCKLNFHGNQRHDVYFGMIDIFKREFQRRRYARHDVNLSFKTNGTDLFSGYTLLFGGFDNDFTALMRGDHVVAANGNSKFPPFVDIDDLHLFWRRLRVESVDHRVRAWLDDELLIDYTEEDPTLAPTGTHMALWTFRNGIIYARVNASAESITTPERPTTTQPYDQPAPDGWLPLEPGRVTVSPQGLVTNQLGGGQFAVVWPMTQTIDLTQTPILSIPLDIPVGSRVNLHLIIDNSPYLVHLTAPTADTWQILGDSTLFRYPHWAIYAKPPLSIPHLAHTTKPRETFTGTFTLDLHHLVKERRPGAKPLTLNTLMIGNTSNHRYLSAGLDGNLSGAIYTVGKPIFSARRVP